MAEWFSLSGAVGVLGLIGTLVAIWNRMTSEIKELKIRINRLESNEQRIIDKLDSIAEDIMEIKIELQNKQNR